MPAQDQASGDNISLGMPLKFHTEQYIATTLSAQNQYLTTFSDALLLGLGVAKSLAIV